MREGYVESHPWQRLEKLKTPKDLRRTLDQVEIRRFVRACKGRTKLRDRALALFLYDTGCRIGEALTLALPACRFDAGYALVRGKGNKRRIVPVSPHTAKAVRDYVRWERKPRNPDEETLFLTFTGAPLFRSKFGICHRFQEIARRAGLERANPHMWRHTAATEMLRNGANTAQVQKFLGHEHISTTEIYTHLMEADVLHIHRSASPAAHCLAQARRVLRWGCSDAAPPVCTSPQPVARQERSAPRCASRQRVWSH